jgi:hypothetical protein
VTEHDVETLVRNRLNEHVDTLLGPRRDAPPFEAPAAAPANRSRWLTPLLAAACVVAVAAGALVAATMLGGGGSPQQPAGPTSTPRPAGTMLDGARIVLPRGWVVRPYARWLPKGYGSAYDYCISPTSMPVRRSKLDNCPIGFTRVRNGTGLDPDIEGGLAANPHPCGRLHERVNAISNTMSFGGRPADHRAWSIACVGTNRVQSYLQYVVVGKPAFVLYTGHGGQDTGAAMEYIAAHSQLPKQDAPLPLFDRGRVTAVTPTPSGIRVTLQRVSTPDGTRQVIKDRSGRRYTYLMPKATWHAAVGSLVTVYTDGHRVTMIYKQAR